MQYKKLFPDQILTLNDYPVYSEQVLKLYHRMFWKGQGRIVPPCPVVKIADELFIKGIGKKAEKYNRLLTKFLKQHPKVQYVIVDGSHKTTAATLCGKFISVMVFQTDADIKKARKLVEKGELVSLTTGDANTMNNATAVLKRHFFKHMRFETVAEKTARMVRRKVVPKYMIKIYEK